MAVLSWKVLKRDKAEGPLTYRVQVRGGWLVCVEAGEGRSMAMTFLPDPHHEWDIEPE